MEVILLLLFASGVRGSTHWVVTEDGKIQEQVYSVFHLRRPYDLVALMQQEIRADMVENFMDELDGRIDEIDGHRETGTNLQERFYSSDEDCMLADKPLTEHNLHASMVATCEEHDARLQELCWDAMPMSNPTRPNCSRTALAEDLKDLHKLEHTIEKAMEEVQNVSFSPDFSLFEVLPNIEDISSFGHLINRALEQNGSSWIMYNIAGYYFRLAGDAHGAIECIRRALHFSPQNQKYIALLNLANVLHQGQHSEAASVVIAAALEIDPNNTALHFTLGNIYAALTEYDKSVEAFDAFLRLKPGYEAAVARRHAVLCHSKLEKALETKYNSLQNTLSELVSFEKRLEFWQKQQLKLIQEQTSPDVRLSSEIDYAAWKIRLQLQDEVKKIQVQTRVGLDSSSPKSAANKKKDCAKLQKNGQLPAGCGGQPVVANVKMHLDYPFKKVEMQVAKLKSDLMAKQNEEVVNRLMYLAQVEGDKVTKTGQTTKATLLSEMSEEKCDQLNSMGGLLVTIPIFFFPDKKNLGIGKILSDIADDPDSGMTATSVPICRGDTSNGFDNLWNWIFSNIKLTNDLVVSARSSVREYIASCCGFISIEEFGRRIAVAVDADLAPKWMLYHMAASYWWAMGDLKNLSECLMHSKALSPDQYKHITVMPFTTLLSLNGLHLAAINFLKYSVDLNVYRPDIVMLLADLYVMTGELDKALGQYTRVLDEEPENQDAWKRVMFTTCRLRKQRAEQSTFRVKVEDVDDQLPMTRQRLFFNEYGFDEHCHDSRGDGTDDGNCMTRPSAKPSEVADESDVEETESEHDDVTPLSRKSKDELESNADEDSQSSDTVVGIDELLSSSFATTPTSRQDMNDVDQFPIEDDPLPDILLQVRETPKFTAPFLCKHLSPTNFKQFTSTWLSVSAKGIAVSKLLDTRRPIAAEQPVIEPMCDANHPSSALTLDHLAGVKHRYRLSYAAETGLREAFQTLGREGEGPESVETMGTRLALALQKNSTSWVLTTLSALYWRVTGHAGRAIDCLRQALHHSPRNMRDIPLTSLANVFHRAGLYNDALIVANMALEISPGFVVIHFTLANIFAAKGNIEQAMAFYESTLMLQSSFEPARDRLRAISCSSALD